MSLVYNALEPTMVTRRAKRMDSTFGTAACSYFGDAWNSERMKGLMPSSPVSRKQSSFPSRSKSM